MDNKNFELATLGTGCFWCTEAVFDTLMGVDSVFPGYSGGHVVNPTYEQICEKTTGHAEVVQIKFDPTVISFEDLLEVFWRTHNPTTPNRQGNDVGPQYRSVIFYHDENQKTIARKSLQDADVRPELGDVIDWNLGHWEVSNMNENQLVGGQVDSNFSVVCNAFLVRKSNLQIERVRSN